MMADQNRNQQSNQKTSRGQQGQGQQGSQKQQTQGTQGSQSSTGKQNRDRDDEATGMGQSQRERSTREPMSTAHDRSTGDRSGLGRQDQDLGSESDVESDIDDSDLDDESNR